MTDDLRNDLKAMHAAYVDGHVGRRLNLREGDATNDELDAWAQQAHDKWMKLYPAAHAYRFGLPGPDFSALKDACDEYITAYMSEDDADLRGAADKVRRALRGEDPYGGHGKSEPLPQAVTDFLDERTHFITALKNCPPDNLADYHRWQGHAEARRKLAEQLERAGQ